MDIELKCSKCGGIRFVYPLRLNDESTIICADCDAEIGTVAQLKQKVVEALAKQPTL